MSEDEQLVEAARGAALRGGEEIRASGRGTRSAERKGAGDYVTEVDRRSEARVRDALAAATPGIPVLGEESGGERAERYWLVDPLDGTTNFLHGLPIVGVSVALVVEGRPTVGVVHAPFLGTTWTARSGAGADRDGTPIRVADRPVDRAVVGTGFPFRRKDLLPRYLRAFAAALERVEDLRRPGAASLDLAWVAEGATDGFFELALGPWDVAAGGLLVREAGGVVTDWAGGDGWLGGDVLAGSPAVHAALREIAGATRT